MTEMDVTIIPVITGLTQLFKQIGVPKKVSPLVSITMGLFAGIVYINPGNILDGILSGLIVGLSATGLYESSKGVLKTK